MIRQLDIDLFKQCIKYALDDDRIQYCLWAIKNSRVNVHTGEERHHACAYFQFNQAVHSGVVRRYVGNNFCKPETCENGFDMITLLLCPKDDIESAVYFGHWIPSKTNVNTRDFDLKYSPRNKGFVAVVVGTKEANIPIKTEPDPRVELMETWCSYKKTETSSKRKTFKRTTTKTKRKPKHKPTEYKHN